MLGLTKSGITFRFSLSKRSEKMKHREGTGVRTHSNLHRRTKLLLTATFLSIAFIRYRNLLTLPRKLTR
ncbi:MAG: hypothetical protein JWP59_2616 [Massilia sp.]|nr:hypothetical protein [Massilia sp.]